MSEPPATLPRLLRGLAERHGDRRVALQEKRYGIWQTTTWAGYYRRVRRLAQGMAALGLESGAVVAILGDNRPEWLIAELAAQSLGGMSLGLYADGVAEEVGAVIEHGEPRLVVAEDQEQVDKLVNLRASGRLPTVEWIVYYDPHGLERYDLPYLLEFSEVEARGEEFERSHPGWFEGRLEAGGPEDVAVLCTTSGTTGRPKVAMLSHRSLLAMGSSLLAVDPVAIDDEYLCFLPLAWIGEQMMAVACGLQVGFTLSFPEQAETVRDDLREIGPRVMFSPPRIWESLASTVQVRLEDAGWLKRAAFGWGLGTGRRAAERRLRGQRLGPLLGALHLVADWVALGRAREQLGLTRLRRAYTGGAPLGPDAFGFFHAIGVNLKQIYGQTEICGIAVLHRDGDIRFDTVGRPIPGTEVRISEAGEILLRSEAVFGGYLRNPEATDEALEGGWLHTGDAGYLDRDGHLVVIDRARDVMRMPDGTTFSPAFVENKLKFSPYVQEAVVFGGEGLPYVAALIAIDMENVGPWAERERISYTTYTDLAQKPEVYREVARVVARANEELPSGARVRRFVLLPKQLDADDEELTRTRKVRRQLVGQRYSEIVAALYSDAGSVTVQSLVTYQDGATARRDVPLRIASPEAFSPAPRRRLLRSAR